MMYVVYLYKESPAAWQELRYSLRSLEKHLTGEYQVVLVSDRLPAWIANVLFIPHLSSPASRYQDVSEKIALAAKTLPLRSQMLFMYDDQYFVRAVKTSQCPTLFSFDRYFLPFSAPAVPTKNNWIKTLIRTLDILKKEVEEPKNMETHLPRYICNKTLRRALTDDILKKNLQRWTYIGNKHGKGKPDLLTKQVKAGFYGNENTFSCCSDTIDTIEQAVKQAIILNHNDHGLTPELRTFISRMFPNKCRYEDK